MKGVQPRGVLGAAASLDWSEDELALEFVTSYPDQHQFLVNELELWPRIFRQINCMSGIEVWAYEKLPRCGLRTPQVCARAAARLRQQDASGDGQSMADPREPPYLRDAELTLPAGTSRQELNRSRVGAVGAVLLQVVPQRPLVSVRMEQIDQIDPAAVEAATPFRANTLERLELKNEAQVAVELKLSGRVATGSQLASGRGSP